MQFFVAPYSSPLNYPKHDSQPLAVAPQGESIVGEKYSFPNSWRATYLFPRVSPLRE